MNRTTKTNKPLEVDTVIVGAGVTGISTALHLLDRNYKDFLIVEAQDYIGGRCQTYDLDNGFLEIGSDWLQGQKNNPLYDLALEYGHLFEEDKKFDEYDSTNVTRKHLFMTQYGEYISFELAQKICDLLDESFEMASQYRPKSEPLTDRLVGEYLYENFFNLCEKQFNLKFKHEENDETNREHMKVFCMDFNVDCTLTDLKSLLNGFFMWRCKLENVDKACHSVYNMSLRDFSVYTKLPGKQKIPLKSGFKSLLDSLISKHKKDFDSRILLKHSVEKILLCEHLNENKDTHAECSHCEYDKDKTKLVLLVTDSKLNKLVLKCNHVVVTPSLGYLKENLDKLIQPNRYLTTDKKEAIERVGFGNFMKIFLVYDKPFWDSSFNGLRLIWIPNYEVTHKNVETLQYDLNKKLQWYHNISSINTVHSHPNALCTYVPSGEGVSDLDDEQITNELTNLMRQFLGTKSIPYPKLLVKCDWSKNDYVRGAKCYLSLDSKPSYLNDVEKPITFDNKPYVLFGGEATSSEYFGTVHSAFLSGCREAQRILNKSHD